MANLEFLKNITMAKGISGFEKDATRVMKDYLSDCTDEIMYDNIGSIVGVKKGTGDLKFLIAGHIDEIGFVVKEITPEGYIKVHPIGGWRGQNIPIHTAIITTREGKEIVGVFGFDLWMTVGKTPDQNSKVTPPGEQYLDIGVDSKEEAVALGIRLGDPITPRSEFMQLANPKYLMAKAWDDRVGAAIACDVLKELKDETTVASVYAAGTVQEEVGCRGARTVGHMVRPDVAIAVDVTFSRDVPNGAKNDVHLGCGVTLGVLDSSVIAHTGLLKTMEKICEDLEIPYVLDVLTAGGTDSSELHKVGAGVVNMTLSIPSRYMHTHRTIINSEDYDKTVKVLAEFARRLTPELLEEIKADKR